MEYRRGSATCISLRLPATPLRGRNRQFPSGSLACTRLLKTLNPKVVGSNPTRPITIHLDLANVNWVE